MSHNNSWSLMFHACLQNTLKVLITYAVLITNYYEIVSLRMLLINDIPIHER